MRLLEKVFNKIVEDKVISIIRTDSSTYEDIKKTVQSVLDGGVGIIEITLNTPSALSYIKQLKEDIPEILIGAGTVLDTESAKLAIEAGADFMLTPTLNKDVIKLSNRYNKLVIPGVLTPTEALTASEYGARLIKVFPVSSLGPAYIKDLLGPLNHLKLMPVGGVTLENVKEFMDAGSSAVGVGSSIVNKTLIDRHQFEEIKNRSRQFQQITSKYK